MVVAANVNSARLGQDMHFKTEPPRLVAKEIIEVRFWTDANLEKIETMFTVQRRDAPPERSRPVLVTPNGF